jgi:tetratricopeptide (TPR) repeat protein
MGYLLGSLILIFMLPPALLAQEDWRYLYDEQEERAAQLFEHYYSLQDFPKALPHLEWLLDKKQDTSYCTKGAFVYEFMSRNASDDEDALRYANLCLRMYDDFIRYSGDTIRGLNRKLHQAYQLFYDRAEKYPVLLSLSEEVMLKTGNLFAFYNFSPLINLMVLMEKDGKVNREKTEQAAALLQAIAASPPNSENRQYQLAIARVRQILHKQSAD